jgi:hypothetical protein
MPRRCLRSLVSGRLDATCSSSSINTGVDWVNDTTSTINYWLSDLSDVANQNDEWVSGVRSPGESNSVVFSGTPATTLSLGVGNDPGSRRVATINVFAFQQSNGAPCGFQAQGTLWTSG